MSQQQPICPKSLRITLFIAGAYNLLWGASVVVFPHWFFNFFNMPLPTYPEIWQCVGMVIGVYGIGYLIAASDPYKHWVIVLVGMLGKVFGPIGFLYTVYQGVFPTASLAMIVFNDLIWWAPFMLILYGALRSWASVPFPALQGQEFSLVLNDFVVGRKTLLECTMEKPYLVVFLRHFGCVFCQKTIYRLQKIYPELKEKGIGLAIVHSSDVSHAQKHLAALESTKTIVISDPQCRLYQAFKLSKGNFRQLFGWDSFKNGVVAFLEGHGVGKLQGDGFQLPGAFIVYKNEIINAYRCKNASDQPDFKAMVEKSVVLVA